MLKTTFNYAGIVLNCRRTSLSTDIGGKLTVGACRHKNPFAAVSSKYQNFRTCVLETNVTTAEEAEEDDEHAEVVKEFWDDFFGEL